MSSGRAATVTFSIMLLIGAWNRAEGVVWGALTLFAITMILSAIFV